MILRMRFIFQAFLLCILQGIAIHVHAQLNPIGALYFQNQYLGNPAMAGRKGFDVNMGYRKQWSNIPGGPSSQIITGEYAFARNAGIGLNVSNETSGLFKSLRSVASYAYHMPLNENNTKLSFGLSLGFLNERLSREDMNGDPNDIIVANYNQTETYIDGDFGLAYTSNKLSVQAALPNIKGIFQRDLVNQSINYPTFFSAVSYKIDSENPGGISLEPKVVYRGIKGLNNILDIGANVSYANNKVNLFGMYHSIGSATFGLGMNYQSFGIIGIYSTNTTSLAAYSSGTFEIGLKASVFK